MNTLRSLLAKRGRRGQSMVEFALIVPLFLLMLFGLVDMGRLVYASTTMSQAAREAARVGSVEAFWVGNTTDAACGQTAGPTCPTNEAALKTDIVDAANRMMEPFASIASGDVHLSCTILSATPPSGEWTSPPNGCSTASVRQPGNRISIRIAMDFEPITPLIGQFFNSIELSGSATMTIN